MKELMIGFHRWMLKHDTADNAEEYFHYTDRDMVEEYLKEVSTQDPAICNYSGLRPVEGYREEKIDKELNERIIERATELADTYRAGWLAGYDEGLYDGQYK